MSKIEYFDFGDECVDAYGDEWPEHDFGEIECSCCGAEAEPDEGDEQGCEDTCCDESEDE